VYRGGANDAAAHRTQLTGLVGGGGVGIGVFENVRAREGESAFS